MQKAKFWPPLSRYFMATGRISRLQYLVQSLILLIAFKLVSTVALMVGQTLDNGHRHLIAIVLAVTSVLTAYVYFCLDAKRMHDTNVSAIVAAVMLSEPLLSSLMTLGFSYAEFRPPGVIAIMSTITPLWQIGFGLITLILLLVPGTRGDNKYGTDPLLPPAPPINVF